MTDALEALEDIKQYISLGFEKLDKKEKVCFLIEFPMIEKELKALELIKEKKVATAQIIYGCNLVGYNYYARYINDGREELTEEEFKLLKEVLN